MDETTDIQDDMPQSMRMSTDNVVINGNKPGKNKETQRVGISARGRKRLAKD